MKLGAEGLAALLFFQGSSTDQYTIEGTSLLCLLEGEVCDGCVIQRSCCGQLAHQKCVKGWDNHGQRTCPLCQRIPPFSPAEDPSDILSTFSGSMGGEEVMGRLH